VLSGLAIKIIQKAGEDGKLFGSVTVKDIAAAIAVGGVEIDRKKIVLGEPIKSTGTFEVTVKLVSDVTATVKVEVVAK
jgi:large subunit ribosomal protein L9